MPKEPKQKTFNLHWGSGIVEEEATIETPYHKPSIQLLKFTEGEAAGDQERAGLGDSFNRRTSRHVGGDEQFVVAGVVRVAVHFEKVRTRLRKQHVE